MPICGGRCPGDIVKVECRKADLEWKMGADGRWSFRWNRRRSHIHLFCSEEGNHTGGAPEDPLKFYYDELPEQLRRVLAEVP